MLSKIKFLIILFTGTAIISSAQNFSGVITFKRQSGDVPTNCMYYVKGDMVRYDEFKPGGKALASSFIMDLKANTMMFIDHDRQLYGTQKQFPNSPAAAGCVVSTTTGTKDFLTYKCTEQVVKNISDSTQISFLVAPGNFAFFMPMLKMINSHEKFSTYYFAITNNPAGSMPVLAIMKDWAGNEKERMEVTKVETKSVANSVFDAPAGYTEMK